MTARSDIILRAENLLKQYPSPDGRPVTALRLPHLEIRAAEQTAVVGPSGCGKSTLLSLLGGILEPTAGTIVWERDSGAAGARGRARRTGFVFQDLNLLPSLTVEDNLRTAARLLGTGSSEERIPQLLDRVGLAGKRHRKPHQLSRGEQQRAAAARAVLHPHALILADEPTASLDETNAAAVMDLLAEMARENGSALLTATHDPRILGRFTRRIELTAAPGERALTA